ncbi:hypothetical protein DPEC_G00168830 [Dallia pectoralis]|uniref:Uncharacterized protein n=1 Tax=Dallia pectoralis TaxID=75939 RepID=A0ACC2GCW2_DALPE|nr:hypothetical protein DPEC_G00168830 [Dallia pectoralis]
MYLKTYSNSAKEEICWEDNESLGLNIVMKEEYDGIPVKEEELTVSVKEIKPEHPKLNEDDKDALVKFKHVTVEESFGVKHEDHVTGTTRTIKKQVVEENKDDIFGIKEEISITVKEEKGAFRLKEELAVSVEELDPYFKMKEETEEEMPVQVIED